MESHKKLEAALTSLPIPGAPPALPRTGAWIGLAFLETALRLNHVRRMTETISLADARRASRQVELDISLNALDEVQASAGVEFSRLRARRAHASPVASGRSLLWVPIARLSRDMSSPVEVRDATGTPVPRLTQAGIGPLLASGLYQLLQSTLWASQEAADSRSDIAQFLTTSPESRWLTQLSLRTLFDDRAQPTQPWSPARGETGRPGALFQRRQLAVRVINDNHELLEPYLQLLDVALSDHLIVVGLADHKDEHHLSFEAPMRAVPRPAGRKRWLKQMLPGYAGYRISYKSTIPSTLKSYHLEAVTEAPLTVEKLVMTCDADRHLTDTLADDLRYLDERLEKRQATVPEAASDKILELELESAARTAAELRRRREWQAQQAGGHLDEVRLSSFTELSEIAIAGVAHETTPGEFRSSLLVHPKVRAGLLSDAARELIDSDLLHDVTHQRDPVSQHAHAYWRHPDSSRDTRESFQIKASLLISDGSGSGTFNVLLFVAAVLAVSYAVGAGLFSSPLFWSWVGDSDPPDTAASVNAVLLLVPGYLYSRIERPRRVSILARLRRLSTLASYISIGSIVGLAAFVATSPGTASLRIPFWATLGVQTLLMVALAVRRLSLGSRQSLWKREVAAAARGWLTIPKVGSGRSAPSLTGHDAEFAGAWDVDRSEA